MFDKLLLVGGGGHCHSVLDSLLSNGSYTNIGIVAKDQDNYNELLTNKLIAPYLVGVDADLPKLFHNGWKNAFITLGSIGNTNLRRKKYSFLTSVGFELPALIDPSAILSNHTEISKGVFIGKRAVINSGCKIGINTIINTGAIVEHDCVIGNFVHISSGSVLCGGTTVGDDTHIGAGSITRQLISIGSGCMIGAGSVVVMNIPDNEKAYGNPCKVIHK